MSDTSNYQERRRHLIALDDKALKERFWQLTEQLIDPLMELGYRHTTPSIERSVLMRMGFSSIEVKRLVEAVIDHGLMPKGAGHVVFRASQLNNLSIRDAGLALINDQYWSQVAASFVEVKNA